MYFLLKPTFYLGLLLCPSSWPKWLFNFFKKDPEVLALYPLIWEANRFKGLKRSFKESKGPSCLAKNQALLDSSSTALSSSVCPQRSFFFSPIITTSLLFSPSFSPSSLLPKQRSQSPSEAWKCACWACRMFMGLRDGSQQPPCLAVSRNTLRGKAGRTREGKPACFDDWSQNSDLNFWFYSSIKGSWQKRSRFGRVQLARLGWAGQPQHWKARPDFPPWCQTGNGIPREPESGRAGCLARRCLLPASASNAAFLAPLQEPFPPRRLFAMFGREAPSLSLRVSAGAGEPNASLLGFQPPPLPNSFLAQQSASSSLQSWM